MNNSDLERIKDEEFCPCGSGSKYSSCCKYRKDDKSFNIEEYLGNNSRLNYDTLKVLRESKFRTCFHPTKDECTKDIKNAHTLQNNGVLSLLAEGGHVMEVKHGVDIEGLDLTMKPQGKNKATTFTGFCGYHDTVLFKSIETLPYSMTTEQNFLYAYRIYALEHYKKLVASTVFKKAIRKKPSILKEEMFIQWYRNQQLAEQDVLAYQDVFNSALLNSDYDVIESHVIEFDYQISFAAAFGFLPEFDIKGNLLGMATIMDFDESRLPMNYVTIFPTEEKSYIIYSWLKDDSTYFKRFTEQLKGLSDAEVKRCFNNLVPEYSENIVISPRLWNRFSEHQKSAFISTLQNNIGERENDLFGDDMVTNKVNLLERPAYNLFRKM